MFEVMDLDPMVLPQAAGIRRRPVIPARKQPANFDERYDWWTLVYGAARRPGGLVLVCPKLVNLRGVLKEGVFRAGGAALRMGRLRRYRRHDELYLKGEVRGDRLEFSHGDMRLSCPVQGPWEGFNGRRCLVTTSKNNEMDWIVDWVAHHVRHQGSEAVLLHDNLSTLYEPGEILERLRGVAGLKAARVVSVPCRYGPLGTRPPRGLAKFLQGGLLNLARQGALSEARSVLQCDIDEIAVSDEGRPGLHEAAETARLGFATAPAFWRSAAVPQGSYARHGDHDLAWTPERGTKEKWAVVPGRGLGRFHWDVHGVAGYLFNKRAMVDGVRFYHCERLSTDWKRPRSAGELPEGAVEDAQTKAALARVGLPRS
ncbi:hypothetical protein [Vannielia sp.]|uniref:hypothetical protein n=1 Tax=Vannielia sp. TaxID=2813045 RepID=UPI0026319C0E|nr:hypothetical protein [Vannielia sp.]MDF1872108.1 hypothetical protein [Vannielia sp.]